MSAESDFQCPICGYEWSGTYISTCPCCSVFSKQRCFEEIELSGPGIRIRFKASRERTAKIMEFVLKEAMESNSEPKACK